MTDARGAGLAPSLDGDMQASLLDVAARRAREELGHTFGDPLASPSEERYVCQRCGDCYYHVPGNRYAYGSAIWAPCGTYSGRVVRDVAVDAPESAPQSTPAADAPPDDAEVQEGAARGSDVWEGCQDFLAALAALSRARAAREN